MAIIVLTLLVRLIFMPLSVKALRSQKLMARLQPKIKELQMKHKDDKAAQAQAVMALYKENKVNPASGCLPLIVQLPVLFALYKAFANGFKPESLGLLYGFISNPDAINSISFGFFDLSKNSPILAVISGAFQFLHSKLSFAKQESDKNLDAGSSLKSSFDMGAMNKQMLYFFPIMIIIIGWKLPAGLVLYWAVTTLFSTFEQLYINKKFPNLPS